ncbi:carbohydrate ABC transporter permease [Paenibacillus puerhi]|uniref:carbohydrate ABC transporter permease n=1 Tax=Paenibacillus puerhi TaxID=2692622 RepID=UPI00135C27B4|nr:sugar ABC transporter permease [Paenibacillus puerhi]
MANNETPSFTGRRSSLSVKQQRYLFIYGCLLIPLIFFITIRILPILYSFNISVREWDLLSDEKPFVGLGNFVNLFQDPVFLQALRNTVIYVAVGVPGQLILGLAVALLLQRITRLKGLYRVIYFLPYVTSVVAVSWVFRWILLKNGVVNGILVELGIPAQLFLGSATQAIYLVIAVMIWQALGFQMLIFLAGLENIPAMYEEAAAIDGANGWQRFIHVTLPLLNPVIVFSVVIGTISFLQSFTQVLNLTLGGPLNSTLSLVLHIYNLGFKHFKMGDAAAATVVLFAAILLLSLVQMKLLNKKIEY